MSEEVSVVPSSPSGGSAIERGVALSPIERILELAVTSKVDVAALEKLVALHERVSDRQASQEFAEAMARFQESCPPVRKTSEAEVITKSGAKYRYVYAELDEIARTVRPHLHKEGLSYSWDSELSADGARIRCTCIVAHANGHRRTATFESPTEALTQAMSPQQRHAAALTYARRQSLIQALGLCTTDPDSDGSVEEDRAVVTAGQAEILEALIGQRPDGARARLLAYLGVESLEQIPANKFEWLKADLEAKLKGQK